MAQGVLPVYSGALGVIEIKSGCDKIGGKRGDKNSVSINGGGPEFIIPEGVQTGGRPVI